MDSETKRRLEAIAYNANAKLAEAQAMHDLHRPDYVKFASFLLFFMSVPDKEISHWVYWLFFLSFLLSLLIN